MKLVYVYLGLKNLKKKNLKLSSYFETVDLTEYTEKEVKPIKDFLSLLTNQESMLSTQISSFELFFPDFRE